MKLAEFTGGAVGGATVAYLDKRGANDWGMVEGIAELAILGTDLAFSGEMKGPAGSLLHGTGVLIFGSFVARLVGKTVFHESGMP